MATDFSSLDKLIEFGLGLGIATQMMNTMNSVIARTAVPGVGLNPGVNSQPLGNNCEPLISRDFYIVNDDKVAGPFDESELAKLVSNKKLKKETFCWKPGMNSWTFAENIPEVNKIILLNS